MNISDTAVLKVLDSVGSPRILKIDFHQQKLSSLLIACNIKLEGALYSVFYAEASKRPWTRGVFRNRLKGAKLCFVESRSSFTDLFPV